MNIREQAIEFVRANPGCTSRQIAEGTGNPRSLIQPLMTELYIAESVTRQSEKGMPFTYQLPSGDEFSELSEDYRSYRKQAQELESKGFWRRAARVWLLAMDSTRNALARDKAAARRAQCINYGSTRFVSEEMAGGNSVSVYGLVNWSDEC